MKPELLIALGAFLAGLIPYGIGLVAWYGGSREKKYAAQRDFEHLKNNQKQISEGIAYLSRELENSIKNTHKDNLAAIASLQHDIDDYFETLNRDILEIKLRLDIDIEKKQRKKHDEDYK